MPKGRVGFYDTKGGALKRTHSQCPTCGPGTFLAIHKTRLSCGRCGYSEAKKGK